MRLSQGWRGEAVQHGHLRMIKIWQALTLQTYFSKLTASTTNQPLSHESRDKIRDVLSSALRFAVQHDLLVRNPAESLRIPPDKRGKKRNKPYLTPQQFDLLVELIPEPYASMVHVAIYTGLRVSELAGLRWNDIGTSSITIDERFCRGDWGAPKSEASNATIGVNSCVIDRIHRLKGLTVEVKAGNAIRKYKVVKSDGPDDLVFQGVQFGGPLRDNNILVRFIKPAARSMELPWVNWRSLRTSHATWLKIAGADVKDAQAQMRHSRSSTTLDIYQQFVPESQQRAVDRLSYSFDRSLELRTRLLAAVDHIAASIFFIHAWTPAAKWAHSSADLRRHVLFEECAVSG
jgi:integrase